MKIKHSTDIELPHKATVLDFKKALEDVPDNATLTTLISVTPADRPWESQRTSAILHAEWEAQP